MRERQETKGQFTIFGKDDDDFSDIVAAVVVKDGKGGIAGEARLTVPMLAILRQRHQLPTAGVLGGEFDIDKNIFTRGTERGSLEALRDLLKAEGSAPIVFYTHALLKGLAYELTDDQRWEL
ncbi:hypothetical protein LVJ94_51245 [Pendulispora rubella]|uniref:Uncharacterized protein n=1 Tax=Pendulispora rubella TaxID=2741070 RepID=A0ABZ2L974_9BACT